jgi:flagellar assembly protein FliH
MSSSKILKGTKNKGCSITSYDIQDMGARGKLTKIEEAHLQAEEIVKKAKGLKEAIEMQAYNEGIEKGQAEGRKMAIKKSEPLFDTFKNAIDELSCMRQSIVEKHQDQLLEIIFLITEKIIHRSIQLTPEVILDTVRAASSQLMDTDDIRLRLHPSDFEYIRDIENILARKLSGKKQIHVIEDTSIDRGGIIIDTEFGEIDATIRSQIDHMKDMLREND